MAIFYAVSIEQKKKHIIEPIDLKDSHRYHEKLTYEEKRLPASYYGVPSDKWSCDLSALLSVTLPDIFCKCVLCYLV